MQQTHSNTGDNVARDKIDRQINMGASSTYVENQLIQYAEKKIPRALTKPPFKAEIFLGREDDLSAIQSKLFSDDPLLLLVNGQGGVGKTTIAAEYYATYQTQYAHTAWVLSEKSIANALITQLASPLGIDFDPTDTEATRLDKILSGMANLENPCLLVLDNANEVEDLKRNYLALRRCRNFHLLLTSRITEFEQAVFYPIAGLPEDKALELFEKYYKKPLNETEKPLFSSLYQAIGGNTLVVEILAKNLYLFNRLKAHYSLADLLDDLQTRGLLALSKSQAVATAYHAKDVLREAKPEDIIAAMYDLSELTREETALLAVFAVLPAENIGFDGLEALMPDTDGLEKTALDLAQAGWLEFDRGSASFKCHPVVQEITRNKNKMLWGDCAPLLARLIDKLDPDTLHEENYKYSTVFARYAETVVNAFEKANINTSLLLLCQGIGNFNAATGSLDKAQAWYLKLSQFAKQLLDTEPANPDFKNGLAISYSKLGQTHAELGNLDKALKFYEARSELGKQLYESYPSNVSFKNGLAISYYKLGDFYKNHRKDKFKANVYFKQAEALWLELVRDAPAYVQFQKFLGIVQSELKSL